MKKQKKGKKGEECLGRKGLLGEREVEMEQSETGGMGMAKASEQKPRIANPRNRKEQKRLVIYLPGRLPM